MSYIVPMSWARRRVRELIWLVEPLARSAEDRRLRCETSCTTLSRNSNRTVD